MANRCRVSYGFPGEPLRRGRHVRHPRRVRCGFYTTWDMRVAGLGVRVRSSGHRSFVRYRKGESGARGITLWPAALMDVEEACAMCFDIETGTHSGRPERGAVPTFADFVAGPVRTWFDRCKPSPQKGVRLALSARMLWAFGSLPLERIDRARVTRLFDQYSRTAPGRTNHAPSVLLRILNHAVICGHLDANPARGVRHNPHPRYRAVATAIATAMVPTPSP